MRALAPALRPVLQVSELRVVAADDLWLSPQHGTPTLAIHFTWRREPEAVGAVLRELEAALAPFAPRPHWGKLFLAGAERSPRATRAPRTSPSSRPGSTRAARSATPGWTGRCSTR